MNRFETEDRQDVEQRRKHRRPQHPRSRHNNDNDDFDPRRYHGMTAEQIVAMIDEGDSG